MKQFFSNKTVRFLLLTAAFCMYSAVSVFAADGLIYFTDPQAKAGEQVEVEMTIQADGTVIGDAKVTLAYPAESLEFVKGTKTSGGAGTLKINGKGTAESDSKWKYTIVFKVLKSGESVVSISDCEVYEASGAKINMTHLGSSKITAEPGAEINSNLKLSALEISPGKLDPSFSPDVNEYNVTVGLSVERLTINAIPEDTSNTVDVLNNEDLKEGDNQISVIVKAKDGQEQNEYMINVLKTEGGEENLVATSEEETSSEAVIGVQLSCKGKTITIMDIDDSVSVPEGFRGSTIKIDGQPVQGWITGESESPEYFLVYGMNDAGELNFYRYDRAEKTIQRYFEETKKAPSFTEEEYAALQALNTELTEQYDKSKLLICIIGIILFLTVCLVVYLIIRLNSVSKELDSLYTEQQESPRRRLDPEKSRRTKSSVRSTEGRNSGYDEDDDAEDEDEDEDDYEVNSYGNASAYRGSAPARRSASDSLKGLVNEDPDKTNVIRRKDEVLDETRVLRRSSRRRTSRKALQSFSDGPVSSDTTVIRREARRRNINREENEDF